MKKKAFAGSLLSGVLLFGGLSSAQEITGPNEKAERYHKLLLKRPGNPTVFSRFVDAWLDSGDKKGMKLWLEESAKAGGSSEWRVLAAFHEYLGEDEAALDAFNKAVASDDQDAALRLARAKLHAKLLSFEAALEDLKVATADEKLGVEASKLTGIYLARAGRIEDAVTAWKEVIERFPKDEELREDLIEVEVAEGLYDDAIAASQALVGMTKDPYKKALRQLRLGDIQILGNKREDGLETYETIMAATGAGTWLEREVLAQVERVFMREDDIQGLRDFFQKLREAHPRRVSVRKALARQMALNGEMDEAVALFREVLKITPGDVGNREEFIVFLETNERWKEAREELSELLKLREDDPLLWERMAQIEEKQKNPDGMKAALAKVRDLKKGTPEGLIAVAALYVQADLLPESEALLREGRGTFADSDELSEALASFLMQNTKEAEALAIWTEMAKVADREGLLRVARSLTGHGKSDEAFKLLQGRMTEFGKDPLILGQFCNLAFSEEEAEIAVPFGLEMVRQATSPTDLEAAVKVAGRVVKRASKVDEVLKELEGKADANIAEQCFITDLYVEQGDTLKALEILTAAEKADEGLLARFYRVRYEETRGELEKAIASLRAIIELPEGRKTVHVRRLVGLLESADDLTGALKAVDDWKRMAPGDQAAWARRAELLSNHGEADKAVLELRRMIGKFGAEEDSRAKLADALLEANEHRSAQRIYEQLYEEGDDLTAKLKWVGELAKVAKKEGTLDELLADFERRKRENANSVAPLLALAEIHHSLNQYEERRSALLEASRRRPNDIKLLQHIADVEVRAGEFERAVGLLKDAAKRDSTPGTKQKLAELYLKNGEFQEGLRLLKELPDQANDPRKVESAALSLMSMTEWDLAVQYLSEFLPKHPDDWRLRYLYAVALEMDGGEEEAFEIYRDLLEVDQKIKGLKVLYDPKVYRKGYYLKRENLPGAMKGWTKLGVMSQFVDTDVRTLTQLRDGYLRSFGRGLLNLPGEAEELRMLSFLRATRLMSSFEEEKREALLASLSMRGVEQLDLYRMSKGDRSKYFTKIDELLRTDPENPKFVQLWIYNRGSAGKDYKDDPERLSRLIDLAAKQSPSNTISLITGMLKRKEIERKDAATLIESLYQAAPEGEERSDVVASLVYFVSRQVSSLEGDEFHPLARKLIGEAMSLEEKPKVLNWVDQCLAISMTLGEGDSSIALLNQLSGWILEDRGTTALSSNRYSRGYSSSSGSGTLRVPVFPPSRVKGLPQSLASPIAGEFKEGKSAISEAGKRRAELLAQLDLESEKGKATEKVKPKPLEVFRGRMDEIEMPVLQGLIGAALGDEEALPAFVSSVTESKDLEELDLAAGYLWKKKKRGEAYQVLCRMRMLTLSRIQRKEVDGKLAKVGSLLADAEEEWDHEPARRAALRLRKSLTSVNDRQALVSVLIKLGLQKEAEKIGSAPKSRNRSASMNRSSQRNGLPGIINLMTDGRKEEAARTAVKLIKSYQKNRNSHYELKRLTETLMKLDLVDETLNKIHPGESKSITRRLTYANLAQSLDRKELARPIFESLVKDRPALIEARVGLFICQPLDEQDVLNFLGEDQTKIDFDGLLNTMSALWERADSRFDETLTLMGITHGILDGLDPDTDPKRNLSWVPYHVLSATNDTYYNGVRLGHLYQPRKGQTVDEAKTALFDEAARKVFLAMLKHPQTAEQGFMMLVKARENLELKDEDLMGYAQKAVVEVIRRKKRTNQSGYNQQQALWSLVSQNGSSSSHSITDVASPMDYLISNGKNEAALIDELLPSLKENQPEKFESMTLARRIVGATPEEASKLFGEWYAKLEEGGEGAQKKTDEQIAMELVEFTSHLLLFDLKPSTFSDELEKKLIGIKNAQWNDPSGWTQLSGKWMRWLVRHKDGEAARKFIVDICEAAMGPQEKWHILAELGVDQIPDKYKRNGYSLSTKLNSYCAVESVVLPVVELAIESELEKFVQNFRVRSAVYQSLQSLGSSDQLVAWIEATGMLSKSSEGEDGAAATLGIMGIIDSFPNNGGDFSKEMIKAIKAMKLDPLLKQLVLLRYQSSEDKMKSVGAAWEGRIDLLTAMLEKNEMVVMTKLRSWFPDFKAPEDTPKLKAFLETLQATQQEESRKKAEQWLADGVEIDPQDYQGRKLWAEVVKVAELDSRLATKIVIKAVESVEGNQALNRYNSSSGRSPVDYWCGNFFEALVENRNAIKLVDKIRMVDSIYRSETGKKLSGLQSNGGNFGYYLRQSIQNSTTSFKVPEKSKRKQVELAFASWAKELDPSEESVFVSLVVPNMIQNWRFDSNDIKGVTKWADEELRKESALMAEALIIVMQQGGSRRVSGDKREAMEKAALTSMPKLLPLLELPAPLAVDFISTLMASSNGQSLFAGAEQWGWISKVLKSYPNGIRNVSTSRALTILPSLVRQEFPKKATAAKGLLDAMYGTLITPELLLKSRNNSQTWVKSLLPLALEAQDFDLAKRLIQQNSSSFRGELALMLDVAAAIDPKTAAKLAPATTLAYLTSNLPPYTKEIEAAAAQVLEVLPQRDHYRFEVMVASLKDSSDKEKLSEVLRSARLLKLAERFAKEAPGDNSPRWQLLNVLGSEPDIRTQLAEFFKKEATKTSLSTAVTLKDEGNRRADGQAIVSIIQAWLLEELKAGRPEVMLKEIGILVKRSEGSNAYSASQLGQSLAKEMGKYLLETSLKHPEKATAMAALSQKNLEYWMNFNQRNSSYELKGYVWVDLFIHVLAGETQAWYERVENHSKDKRVLFEGSLGKEDRTSLSQMVQLGALTGDARSKDRTKILTKSLEDPVFVKNVMTYYTRLSSFMDAGLITKKELFSIIDALPQDHERKAEFLMEKAGVVGWREEGQVAKAERIYEEARTLALAQKNDKIVHLSDALHARLLGQKKRISEAWNFGKRVDLTQLPEQDQKWFADDSKKWKEKASEIPAETPNPDQPKAPAEK